MATVTKIVIWKLDGVPQIRAEFTKVTCAMSDYYNRRGGAVEGLDGVGNWHRLSRARMRCGTPYGMKAESDVEEWFVLHSVQTLKWTF